MPVFSYTTNSESFKVTGYRRQIGKAMGSEHFGKRHHSQNCYCLSKDLQKQHPSRPGVRSGSFYRVSEELLGRLPFFFFFFFESLDISTAAAVLVH
jgi:hypothetical protein